VADNIRASSPLQKALRTDMLRTRMVSDVLLSYLYRLFSLLLGHFVYAPSASAKGGGPVHISLEAASTRAGVVMSFPFPPEPVQLTIPHEKQKTRAFRLSSSLSQIHTCFSAGHDGSD